MRTCGGEGRSHRPCAARGAEAGVGDVTSDDKPGADSGCFSGRRGTDDRLLGRSTPESEIRSGRRQSNSTETEPPDDRSRHPNDTGDAATTWQARKYRTTEERVVFVRGDDGELDSDAEHRAVQDQGHIPPPEQDPAGPFAQSCAVYNSGTGWGRAKAEGSADVGKGDVEREAESNVQAGRWRRGVS